MDESKRNGRWRMGLGAALLLYLVTILVWCLDEEHPVVAGLFHDDGIYMCLGESLAERGVYRDNHTPEPIQIAKYPPGVPLLALVARTLAGGEIEGALRWLRVLYALFLVLGLWSFHGLVRREEGLGPWTAALLTAAVAGAATLLDYLRIPMSEIPYLGLTLFALWLAGRQAAGTQRPWRHGAELAGVCFLIFAFRTVGAMTPLAVGLWLLLRGRRATAWRFALLGLPPLLLLQLFMSAQGRPAAGWEDITVYGLPYTQIMAEGLGWLPRIIAFNLLQCLFFIFNLVLPGATGVIVTLSGKGMGTTVWLLIWPLAVGITGLLGLGLLRRDRGLGFTAGLKAWHLHLLLSILLVIPWPFQTARFLVPLLPLLLLGVILGLRRLGGPAVAAIGAALLLVVTGINTVGRPPQTADRFTIEGRHTNLQPLLQMGAKLRRILPRDALVASTMDPLLACHFGIRGVWGWTIRNQCADLYGGPRRLVTFGLMDDRLPWLLAEKQRTHHFFNRPRTPLEDPEKLPWLAQEMDKDQDLVREQFRRLGVTHAVVILEGGQDLYDMLLARLIRRLARAGEAKPLTTNGVVQVWQLTLR